MSSGIYLIEFREYLYIGQAQCIDTRIRKHKEALRRGTHKNSRLQNLYNKYGDQLQITILNECEVSDLDTYEQEWLDVLRFYPSEYVLNMCFEPNTTRGYRFNNEQREYLSRVQTGKKKPKDSLPNYAAATKQKWLQGIMKPKPRKVFCLVSPDGVIYESKGVAEFAKDFGLSAGNISSVVNGKMSHTKNWKSFPVF